MDRFEFQLAMLQKGAEELEKKIANFNTILLHLKTAAITIWVALIGWVFARKINALYQFHKIVLHLVSIVFVSQFPDIRKKNVRSCSD